MSELVRGTIEEAVKELGIDYTVIPSGAFHDSLIMTSVFPTGMIFVPSKDGTVIPDMNTQHRKTLKMAAMFC